jgi:hypothetical protein
MSHYDYEMSKKISEAPFYAIIMAAMRRADTRNAELLRNAFPDVWEELKARYDAPGGCLNETELQGFMQAYEDGKS